MLETNREGIAESLQQTITMQFERMAASAGQLEQSGFFARTELVSEDELEDLGSDVWEAMMTFWESIAFVGRLFQYVPETRVSVFNDPTRKEVLEFVRFSGYLLNCRVFSFNLIQN